LITEIAGTDPTRDRMRKTLPEQTHVVAGSR
jgi:hypothetical protein